MTLEQHLCIDMIAITIPIDYDKRTRVLKRLTGNQIAERYKRSIHRRKRRDRYKNNYGFRIFNNTLVRISAYPIRKSQNFFRVEFNPTKLTLVGLKKLIRLLINLLRIDTVKRIYFHNPITRIDIALDVFDMKPDLYIHLPRFEYSTIHRRDNIMLSQVIGSTGRCRLTMYNKDVEQGGDGSGRNYQRIEVRHRDLRCSIHQLSERSISDYLLKTIRDLNFYHSDFLGDVRFSTSFRDDAYEHGLNAALHACDDNRRRRYRRYLETYRVHPISTANLSITEARTAALKGFLHFGYREEFLAKSEAA